MRFLFVLAASAAFLIAPIPSGRAGEIEVPMVSLDDGRPIGSITVRMVENFGVLFAPALEGLPPGFHGFHLHEFGDCGTKEKDGVLVAGLAAGGHYDPAGSGRHEGPYGEGHLGDLPVLWAEEDGTLVRPVVAPRLTLEDVRGRALIIHAGGDTYSDTPEALGGGGARIACGLVPE